MLGPADTRLTLEVALPESAVEERLRSSMDLVRSFLLSPTWGLRRPFVGQVQEGRFRMRVRHGYSNGLTRLVSGRIVPRGRGCRIEVRFHTLRFVVVVLRLAWVLMLLAALPLLELPGGAGERGEEAWVGLALPLLMPAAMIGVLIAIEAVARRMGRSDEVALRQHLVGLFRDATTPA